VGLRTLQHTSSQGFLCGGRGDDRLRGGPDFDIYAFEDGWGRDTISSEAEEGTFDVIAFTGCDLFSRVDQVTQNLTIDLSLGKAFETDAGESGANTVSWSTPGVIEWAAGGSGDDTITGSAGYNLLLGHDGNDTLNATDGEFDEVRCGDGEDTAIVDADDIVSSCETEIPAP
jgi:Ca2+-binding RTX toxin-like protein